MAWVFYSLKPDWPDHATKRMKLVHQVLLKKYGFDELYNQVFAKGSQSLGHLLWKWVDQRTIDGILVNGTASLIGRASTILRRSQSGLVYHYAFVMIIGLVALLSWLLFSIADLR